MYGPSYTWEGFQLMGFQASIFRSASRGEMPVITWITPSDERNLRLKFASALAQGAKHSETEGGLTGLGDKIGHFYDFVFVVSGSHEQGELL